MPSSNGCVCRPGWLFFRSQTPACLRHRVPQAARAADWRFRHSSTERGLSSAIETPRLNRRPLLKPRMTMARATVPAATVHRRCSRLGVEGILIDLVPGLRVEPFLRGPTLPLVEALFALPRPQRPPFHTSVSVHWYGPPVIGSIFPGQSKRGPYFLPS